jgi:hypothetical protein
MCYTHKYAYISNNMKDIKIFYDRNNFLSKGPKIKEIEELEGNINSHIKLNHKILDQHANEFVENLIHLDNNHENLSLDVLNFLKKEQKHRHEMESAILALEAKKIFFSHIYCFLTSSLLFVTSYLSFNDQNYFISAAFFIIALAINIFNYCQTNSKDLFHKDASTKPIEQAKASEISDHKPRAMYKYKR